MTLSGSQLGVHRARLRINATGQPRRGRVVARFDTEKSSPVNVQQITLDSGLIDYYALFDVHPKCKPQEIKAAYRQLQKQCHPDIAGADFGNEMSIIANQAYAVLAEETTRELYDIDLAESKMEQKIGFKNKALSEWVPESQPRAARNWNAAESRALFVDERSCIGCKNCTWEAPDTFVLDETYGRARCVKQWANTESELQTSVDSCPVDCIHWVEREDLPVLEHVMKHLDRVPTSIMNAYNHSDINVFAAADKFRQKKAEGRLARRSWTEAYMYSQAQEEAMSRARHKEAGTGGAPFFMQRLMSWLHATWWGARGAQTVSAPPATTGKTDATAPHLLKDRGGESDSA